MSPGSLGERGGGGGANKVAQSLAKWSFVNNFFGSFDVGFGPSCFELIIKEEALVSYL